MRTQRTRKCAKHFLECFGVSWQSPLCFVAIRLRFRIALAPTVVAGLRFALGDADGMTFAATVVAGLWFALVNTHGMPLAPAVVAGLWFTFGHCLRRQDQRESGRRDLNVIELHRFFS